MPKLPTMNDMGGLADMGPKGGVPKVPSSEGLMRANMGIADAVQGIGNQISAEIKKEDNEVKAEEVNEADVTYRTKQGERFNSYMENPDLKEEDVTKFLDEGDKDASEILPKIGNEKAREKVSRKFALDDLQMAERLRTRARKYGEERTFNTFADQVTRSAGLLADPQAQGDDSLLEERRRQLEGNIKAAEKAMTPQQYRKFIDRVVYDPAGPIAKFFEGGLQKRDPNDPNSEYNYDPSRLIEDISKARPHAGKRLGVGDDGPQLPGAPGTPKLGSEQDWPANVPPEVQKSRPDLIKGSLKVPAGQPHEWRILSPSEAKADGRKEYTANEVVKNLEPKTTTPSRDLSNASGRDISQGIYNAFRNIGYTDFGAKTMLAEVHREHGGEFANGGASAGRRPFGFEQEPAKADQINFGFINSTGQRTKEILKYLDDQGLVSYDAPKSRLNPEGIKVEPSQRTLDAMAAWYDKDMREKGARDPNAIIKGADPKQLPELLRDENYNDVTDAHRRTAAYIQWQHPEIYGGKYRNGIAGQRHYDMMMANRDNLDRIIDGEAPTRLADASDSGKFATRSSLGGPKPDGSPLPPGAERDPQPTDGMDADTYRAPPEATEYEKLSPRQKLLSMLSHKTLNALEYKARTAQADYGKRFEDAAVAHAARTGEDWRDKDGRTYSEWANAGNRTPNQLSRGIQRIQDAKLRFQAMADLGQLSDREHNDRINELDAGKWGNTEDYAARQKIIKDMEADRQKIRKIASTDSAQLVSGGSIKKDGQRAFDLDGSGRVISWRDPDGYFKPAPEVQSALDHIKAFGNGVALVQTPNGDVTINTANAKSNWERQQAWQTLIDARMAAQKRLQDKGFDDLADPQPITRHEAKIFLGLKPGQKLDPDGFVKHWKQVTDRVEYMVGPEYAPMVMNAIKSQYLSGNSENDKTMRGDADAAIKKMVGPGGSQSSARIERATRDLSQDMASKRQEDLARIQRQNGALEIGVGQDRIPGTPVSDAVRERMSPDAFAQKPKQAMPAPNAQQKQWAHDNADKAGAQAAFDAKFGEGAFAKALAEGKRR